MSLGYAIIPEQSLVYIRGWGSLSIEELQGMAAAFPADPRFRPALRILADLRPVTLLSLSSDDVRMRLRSAFDGDARRAIVVESAETYGMARMYQLTAELDAATLRIFSDLPEAFAWLGLPRDTPWPDCFPEATFGSD